MKIISKDLFTIKPYDRFYGLSGGGNDATHYPNPKQSPSDWSHRRVTRWGDVGEYNNWTLICLIVLEIIMVAGCVYLAISPLQGITEQDFDVTSRLLSSLFGLALLILAFFRFVILVKLVKLMGMKKLPGHPGRFPYPGENGEGVRGI